MWFDGNWFTQLWFDQDWFNAETANGGGGGGGGPVYISVSKNVYGDGISYTFKRL